MLNLIRSLKSATLNKNIFKTTLLSRFIVNEPSKTLAKDVLIYKNDNTRYFRIMSFFCMSQYVFWNYMAVCFLRMNETKLKDDVKDTSWLYKINFGESKWRYPLGILSMVLGTSIAIAGFLYCARNVKLLVLRKDGKSVSFVTYGPFGRNIIFTTPLEKVSAKASRNSANSAIPLKVKGKMLHYSVDTRGLFVHPQIFDSTVGLRRQL